MTPRGRRALLLWTCTVPLALGACGSTHRSAAARLCQPRASQLVARTLGLPERQITTIPGRGNNAQPQCSFGASLRGGGRFDVTVNVDLSPQPYAVLARTIEEKQQVFSPTRLVPAPTAITGLGLLAAWFPDYKQLMSTEGVRLVTVTVRWRGASQRREMRFAIQMSRLYLGRNRPSLAKTFP